jgi:hypothetical protein
MSLKGDRLELESDITFFGNSVMTRGGIVTFAGFGSGAANDQSVAYVQYSANSSGAYPLGILLQDMVNYDLTRQHINWYRDEVQQGGKLAVGKKGPWVTNSLIQGAAAIAVGDIAVLTSSGNIMNIPQTATYGTTTWNKAVNPKVGQFLSTLDEDGYAKVEIQFPG